MNQTHLFTGKKLKLFKRDRQICMNIINSFSQPNVLIDDPLCLMKEQKIVNPNITQNKENRDA